MELHHTATECHLPYDDMSTGLYLAEVKAGRVTRVHWCRATKYTCHLTQVNTPRLNPSQPDRYSIYLPQRDGRLS